MSNENDYDNNTTFSNVRHAYEVYHKELELALKELTRLQDSLAVKRITILPYYYWLLICLLCFGLGGILAPLSSPWKARIYEWSKCHYERQLAGISQPWWQLSCKTTTSQK